eukprot:2841519-Amphidinium_carterae.1
MGYATSDGDSQNVACTSSVQQGRIDVVGGDTVVSALQQTWALGRERSLTQAAIEKLRMLFSPVGLSALSCSVVLSRVLATGVAQALRYLTMPVWALTSGATVPGVAGDVDMRPSLGPILSPGGSEISDFSDTVARAIIRIFGLELSLAFKVSLNAQSSENTPGLPNTHTGTGLLHDAIGARTIQPVHPLEVPQALQRAISEPGWITVPLDSAARMLESVNIVSQGTLLLDCVSRSWKDTEGAHIVPFSSAGSGISTMFKAA